MPKTPPPFFTIVIPTLNEARYIPNLLKDLVRQSYSDFEVVIVDGGSSDSTLTKVNRFSDQLRLKPVVSSVADVSAQRNLGAVTAQGQWVIFMDADNRLPSYFLLGVKYQLERRPEAKAFTTWMDPSSYRSRDATLIATTYNLGLQAYSLLKKPTALGALIGVHRSIVTKIKFRNTQDKFEDYDYITQISKHRWPFLILRDPTYIFSMRRFQKEGTLKMMRVYALANINSLLGRTNAKVLANYPMLGGRYYLPTSAAEKVGFFAKLQTTLRHIPRSELRRLQKTLGELLE